MPYKFIRYEKKGRVAYVTIQRPEVLNALHPPGNAEMRAAFADFRDDPEVWVAVVTGSGDRAFSAGNDLKYHAEHVRPGEAYPDADANPFGGITSRFTCWKPIIAAVNGYATGGGLELALACDIIVAAEHAQLGLTEPRVGVVAGAAGTHMLARQVPLKAAMGMLLTGKTISAREAHRLGLVNEVVPIKELMPAAERWAADILECAPISVRASKQMATEGLDRPVEEATRARYSEYERAKASDDYVEGPRAFAEKRAPVWTGR
jgi:enoyl-CoA hydratase/carnithine racemase